MEGVPEHTPLTISIPTVDESVSKKAGEVHLSNESDDKAAKDGVSEQTPVTISIPTVDESSEVQLSNESDKAAKEET